MKSSVPVDALIVTGGISRFDKYGKPIATDMPMLYAWMDRRGFSYPSEDLGFKTLDGLADRGGRYWIATQEELLRIGGREAVEQRYLWISDCRSYYSVFSLEGPSPGGAATPSQTLNASPSGVE